MGEARSFPDAERLEGVEGTVLTFSGTRGVTVWQQPVIPPGNLRPNGRDLCPVLYANLVVLLVLLYHVAAATDLEAPARSRTLMN